MTPVEVNRAGDRRSVLSTITERTVVPLTIAIAFLCFGWWFRDREAEKDQVAGKAAADQQAHVAREIADLTRTIELAKVEILHEVAAVGTRLAALEVSVEASRLVDMSRAEFDNWLRLASARNPNIQWPDRVR